MNTVEAAVHRINMKKKKPEGREQDHSFTLGKTGQVLSQFSGEKKVLYKEKKGWSEFGGCQ